MAKELIVSVNGREKRIAIIENERVSEFYIERGEQHQGIVGNIYKGRVMRVLPGMQSAFVNIGLERDAFLYVSDFFDEEEEFERIVVDKSKKVDAEAAERAAAEQIAQARVEREHHIEATHERAEPLAETEEAAIEKYEEQAGLPAQALEAGAGRRRGRRGRRRGRGVAQEKHELPAQSGAEASSPFEMEEVETPFSVGSSFERVVDEDERAAVNGEMFKDARLQERIFDQIHAVEYDMEDAGGGSGLPATGSGAEAFERIDDSEAETEIRSDREAPREVRAARVRDFADEVVDESAAALEFQRVSDEEEGTNAEGEAEPDSGWMARAKEALHEMTKKMSGEEESAAPEDENARGKRRTPKKRSAKSASNEDDYPDAEARLTSGRAREEFATRRGGRRRRRNKREQSVRADDRANGSGNEATESMESVDLSPLEPEPARAESEPVAARSAPEKRASSGRRRRTVSRRERPQQAITDLLREGQEILVQIAKEPIARKGARITSHIALPGRYLVYMPTVEHVGVSRRIDSDNERGRLRKLIQAIRAEENVPSGGFIVRTAGIGISEANLREDARYLVRTWQEIRHNAEKAKAPALVHSDLGLVQRILRDQLSEEFTTIRVDSEDEYQQIIEFVDRLQPRMVKRVKLHTRDEPILETFGVQAEIDKAIKPRVWLKSGGYLVINQTEALVAIDVNTGKFVGRGATRLEDTITRTNLEAVEEIVRQIRLRDLGGIIVLDLIDMEERRNRQRVMQALQEALRHDKSPTKVLSFNDFGLVIMTRKRVKQSLERTLCAPCPYCQGAGMVKSPQTVCYEILEQARRLSKETDGEGAKQATLRVNPDVACALRGADKEVLSEIEDYLGAVDITSDGRLHQEQFDFAFV